MISSAAPFRERGARWNGRMLRIEPHKAKQVLSLSIPAGLQNAIFAIANLFIQAGVNSFDELMVEGNAAAANADALDLRRDGCHSTPPAQSFMSQNYGAGKRKRIIHSYFISMVFSFGIALVMSALLVIFGRQFLGIFTNVEEVAQAGMIRLRIMGCSYAFSAFMDCTIAGEPRAGQELCADGYRDYGVVRVPHYLGVHGVRVLPHH